ncbi:MAG: hypothetical protein WBQ94_00155 [Terracidiphilus sp.]
MRHLLSSLILLAVAACGAQQPGPAPTVSEQNAAAPMRRDFQIRYVNGSNVYINAGHDAGLAEGTKLVLKQDATKPSTDKTNAQIEPGIIAKLTVVAIASTSAVCEVSASSRELVSGDVVSLPDGEVEKLVEKNALGNTRQYPMVISFSEGDPLDEEVREALPRPPLPEVNQIRGRIGFDLSTIQQIGQGDGSSNMYGMVFRADFTRILGTHWNLNGYWRGNLQTNSSTSQASLQNLINRTYLMSLSYIYPDSHWTAGIGRLYLPWANSLETIDGAYLGRQFASHTVTGVFAGSTPDPTAWDYDPQRRIGGLFFNVHGGSFEDFHYSSTAGGGIDMLKWTINRPFVFTENNVSFKRYFSLFHSMQIDKPTANPSTPAVGTGLGQSLLSLRVQVHRRVVLDLTNTYFRDVPTYDSTLVGTGLLDKYLYQGINGGARIEFPRHITGYFTLGSSSDSTDPKNSLNKLFGATMSNIWKTGLTADARYSKFDSAFASGTYSTITLSRDLLDRLRLNLQAGRYAYSSSVAANSNSKFANLLFDTNLGTRLFLESMFTVQRGGSLNYNQWTTTLGYRFDNRASSRRAAHATQP